MPVVEAKQHSPLNTVTGRNVASQIIILLALPFAD